MYFLKNVSNFLAFGYTNNMEKDKVIQNVYKGATMAVDSINSLLDFVDNEEMQNLLLAQQERYYRLKSRSKQELEQMGITELEELKVARIMARNTMKIRMAFSRTKEKVAKMLYSGAGMGLEELAESENRLKRNGEKVPEIAKEYREMLLNNREELEKYL